MSVRSEDDSGRALGASQGFAPTPSSFSNDPQSLMLEELRELKELIGRAAEEPPLKSQAIWTFLLQFFGLLVGTIFGVFAILAWTEGQQANSMASDGNTLASGANEVAQSAYALAVSANSIASHGNDMGRSAYSLAVTANSLASAGIKSASVGNSYASRGAADARVANDFALMAYCSSVSQRKMSHYCPARTEIFDSKGTIWQRGHLLEHTISCDGQHRILCLVCSPCPNNTHQPRDHLVDKPVNHFDCNHNLQAYRVSKTPTHNRKCI